VIARFLETFFRYKLLILLPAIITPLIVVPFAFLLVKPYYETTAGLWVERPSYVPSSDDWNRYVTPAQNQQQRLTELLQTRTFAEDVARRTSLAPLLQTNEGKDDVYEYIHKVIYPQPTGTKLLSIQVRAEDPNLSMEIVQAVVAAFRERSANERMTQASSAIAFYEQQVKDSEDKANQSRDRVRRYITSNPRLAAGDPTSGAASAARPNLPTSALDPQLSEMTKSLENDERDVQRLRDLLEQARFEASAALDGSDSTLQVLDPPVFPVRAQRERRRLLIFPAAAVAIGGLISALLLVSLTASDRSVRSTADLSAMGRVIGVVPRMGLRRLPRQAGPDTTRRAIAFVAGTALPALPAPRKAG
jgi:capsular polysaccharide biosynthesis protein